MSGRKLPFTFESVLAEAWKDLGERGQFMDRQATSAWVKSHVDSSTLARMASELLSRLLADHERELTLQAERASIKTSPCGPMSDEAHEEWSRRNAAAKAKRDADQQMWRERHQQAQQRYIDSIKAAGVMEWTGELLKAPFALPDGSRVTWGEATVEQHLVRSKMFAAHVEANAQGAARHEQAVEALRQAHVLCLNDLVRSAA